MKSSEVCTKTRSPPASLRIQDQVTKRTTVKWAISVASTISNMKIRGMRIWKCYGIGNGKYIPYDKIYTKHQDPTVLKTIESQGFYDPPDKREVKHRSETSKTNESPIPLFECSLLECVEDFETFAQLELHLDVGKHTVSKFNQYDWALKFSSVNTADSKSSSSVPGRHKPFKKTLLLAHLYKQGGP